MRPVREITAEEENFRFERFENSGVYVIKKDPVEPEPVGTIVLTAWRITGYSPDCDGSLMARMEAIGKNGKATGWTISCIGLSPNTGLVVALKELEELFRTQPSEG